MLDHKGTTFVAMALLLSTSITFAGEDVQSAIDAATTQFGDSFGDAAGLAAMYTVDGQVLVSGQEPIEGREAITAFWKGASDSGLSSAMLTALEITPFGNHATEVGRYKLITAAGNLADHGKYIVIWKKVDGVWKLHRDIISSSVAATK